MRFSAFFLIFILASCSTGTLQKSSIEPYTSTGFALVYDERDYQDKIISGTKKQSKNLSINKLSNMRDNFLIDLLDLKKKYKL